MKIVQPPYRVQISPQSPGAPNLWRCVIEEQETHEVVALHETGRKEDARCFALLELARLDVLATAQGKPLSSRRGRGAHDDRPQAPGMAPRSE